MSTTARLALGSSRPCPFHLSCWMWWPITMKSPLKARFRWYTVHVADLLADALGLGVLAPIDPQGFDDVLKYLPHAARSRFHFDPEELKAEVDSRIQFWD